MRESIIFNESSDRAGQTGYLVGVYYNGNDGGVHGVILLDSNGTFINLSHYDNYIESYPRTLK